MGREFHHRKGSPVLAISGTVSTTGVVLKRPGYPRGKHAGTGREKTSCGRQNSIREGDPSRIVSEGQDPRKDPDSLPECIDTSKERSEKN